MNRITLTFDNAGELDVLCSDEPIEVYWVDPSRPHDRVFLYTGARIGPEHVRSQIGGYAVGHSEDGTLDTGGPVRPKLPPSRPGLSIVASDDAQKLRATLADARAFVAAELEVRIDSHTLGGDMATLDDTDAGIVGEAMDCPSRIDAALAATTALFPDMPEQPTPTTLYTDEHALELCSTCGGTGDGALVWPDRVDPCWICRGGGRVLRRVGPVRDA